MLQLSKNSIVTGVARQQIEIRQLEVDWYCGNYSTIAGQAAMLAGFAFTQLTTPIPADYVPPIFLEFGYLFLTCVAIGLELSVIMLSTFLTVWGPSLALRGRRGVADLHRAVDCLRDYQFLTFSYFIIGWILFFISNICQVWIYFRRRVAVVVTFPLLCFVIAILYYTCSITAKLKLDESEAVAGRIEHFAPYEHIGDLDAGLSTYKGIPSRPGAPGEEAKEPAFCPVHESFQPRLASERARDVGISTTTASATNMASQQSRRLLQQSGARA